MIQGLGGGGKIRIRFNFLVDLTIATNPKHTSFTENVPGNFFVDDRCIDCGLCTAHAGSTFSATHNHAYVAKQPASETDRRHTLEALHSCPVHAIGQYEKDMLTGAVLDSFPIRLEDNIYFCGFANETTYGAASYLITRRDGNILVDVPRFYPKLLEGIKKFGGIRYIFLTHIDDIAGHEEFARYFKAERMMHAADRPPSGTEIIIQGELTQKLADDLQIIPTPGHTRGSMCLLFQNRILFSGDHLAGDKTASLTSFRDACWYSWVEVKKSNEKLLQFDFDRVYPGHGYRYIGEGTDSTRHDLRLLILRM